MNYAMIRMTIARMMRLLAAFLVLPLLVALIYKEPTRYMMAFLSTILILVILSYLLSMKKPKNEHFFTKEGMVIVALIWLMLSFFGALPLWFSGDYVSLVDGFFEAASGFTTTGATVATDVEALSRSVLFWRAFTHLIGGMGVLVFALAILPKAAKANSVYMMKAEVPGPTFSKLATKLSSTAQLLYIIYFALTLILIILLLIGGMPLFDSICHAFATAGTGGFGLKSTSIAYYHSAYIEYVLAIFMLLFGINFNLYYLILLRQVKKVLADEELKFYLGIVVVSVLLICLNLFKSYTSIEGLFRDVLFSVSSIMTTTGFSTADFTHWPLFSQNILLLLMFVGAMAGSTGGGIKVARIVIFLKTMVKEFFQMQNPNRVVALVFNKKSVDKHQLLSILSYLGTYVIVFSLLLIFICLDTNDFSVAFSALAATFNNIGPGFKSVGPSGSYAFFSPLSKILLSLGMIAGRLEIWPVLILFVPTKNH